MENIAIAQQVLNNYHDKKWVIHNDCWDYSSVDEEGNVFMPCIYSVLEELHYLLLIAEYEDWDWYSILKKHSSYFSHLSTPEEKCILYDNIIHFVDGTCIYLDRMQSEKYNLNLHRKLLEVSDGSTK